VQPLYFSKTLIAAVTNAIALSQTPAGAGNLTINGGSATGGIATLDTSRQVLFTFAGNETGHNLTVYGTGEGGVSLQETVAGTASTAATTQSFKTITRIAISAAAAGAIQVGTNGVGNSAWHIVNWHVAPINLSLACIVTGTINYTIQHTYDDPTGTYPNPAAATSGYQTTAAGPLIAFPTAFNHPTLVAQTVTLDGFYSNPIAALRLLINSGTGSVQVIALQGDIAGG
jgi:hypothetical protein